jgi:hypothetical protein
MTRTKRTELIILSLSLLIGFALRFYTFDKKSLWLDEVYTFYDSRDDLQAQINFYEERPTYLHPPLFFILTHFFYPSSKPERDLRIIPLIAGTLSIALFFFLARQFFPNIALPAVLSLTFMVYHISLSQDGKPYSFVMFFGMASLYLFMQFRKTANRWYLFLTAFSYAVLFYSSYSSILFILFSQLLWFYQTGGNDRKHSVSAFLSLAGITFLLILPWLVFIGFNYKGQALMDPFHTEDPGSPWMILSGIVHDWATSLPLLIVSVVLLILFPFLSKKKWNALVLLATLCLPIVGLFLFCRLLGITHFVASRYFINFLPLFLILLYSSLDALQTQFHNLRRWFRPIPLFLVLFIASNLMLLPLYYRSEKMDFRGLATYLTGHLQEGDKIFVMTTALMPGILHYLGVLPAAGRRHTCYPILESGKILGYDIPFYYRDRLFTLIYSKTCCNQYVTNGNRLWIVVFKWKGEEMKGTTPAVLKGYFDGSFLNHDRFPADGSLYLYLWAPLSPNEKGIDLPVQ